MKCAHCGRRYRADIDQPAPGGSSAPGCYFYSGLALVGLAAWLSRSGAGGWKWVSLGAAAVFLLYSLAAQEDCQGSDEGGGGLCPGCGGKNRVRPWSF